jgi:anti-anti-sigma factor
VTAAAETDGTSGDGAVSWTVTQRPSGWVVTVAGEFDLAAEQPWLDYMTQLFDESASPVTVDLSRIDFMDSSGVRALLVLHKRYGERFVVEALSDPVQHLLEITGVLGILSAAISTSDDEVSS